MKKKLWVLLVVVTVIILTACGNSERQVPESEIQDVVDDYFLENTLDGYISQEYNVTHDWDPEAKTDTVTIKAITEYEYGYLVAECECKYQYDRTSELWNLKRVGRWSEYADYGSKWNEKNFTGSINNCEYYDIYFHSIDMEKGEVLWNYDIDGYVYINDTKYSVDYEDSVVAMIENAEPREWYTGAGEYKSIPRSCIRIGNGKGEVNLYIYITVFGIDDMYFLYLPE